MISDLPTINEVVTGMTKKQGKEKTSVPNHSKPKSNSMVYNNKLTISRDCLPMTSLFTTNLITFFSFFFFKLN